MPDRLLLPRDRGATPQRERPTTEPVPHAFHRGLLRVRPHARLRRHQGDTVTARLALHGGRPAITDSEPHFSWPPLTEHTTAAVLDQLSDSISIYDRSGVIQRLEDALCEY